MYAIRASSISDRSVLYTAAQRATLRLQAQLAQEAGWATFGDAHLLCLSRRRARPGLRADQSSGHAEPAICSTIKSSRWRPISQARGSIPEDAGDARWKHRPRVAGACSDELDAPTEVIAGLDAAISINTVRPRMLCARASIIEMAGTSPPVERLNRLRPYRFVTDRKPLQHPHLWPFRMSISDPCGSP
jgi:hypothetical protein